MTTKLLLLSAILTYQAQAGVRQEIDVDRMVDAIRVAEGVHSRHPYGVLSVKVNSEAEAKAVCRRSVINNINRWENAGKTCPFVEFMAARWVPESADSVGHRNWVKNVNKLMGERY